MGITGKLKTVLLLKVLMSFVAGLIGVQNMVVLILSGDAWEDLEGLLFFALKGGVA